MRWMDGDSAYIGSILLKYEKIVAYRLCYLFTDEFLLRIVYDDQHGIPSILSINGYQFGLAGNRLNRLAQAAKGKKRVELSRRFRRSYGGLYVLCIVSGAFKKVACNQ